MSRKQPCPCGDWSPAGAQRSGHPDGWCVPAPSPQPEMPEPVRSRSLAESVNFAIALLEDHHSADINGTAEECALAILRAARDAELTPLPEPL
jgi:hypothetical protein